MSFRKISMWTPTWHVGLTWSMVGNSSRYVSVFSPYQARWIRERRYHPSQQTEEFPDGSLLVSMEVAGTEEVRRWLLGYGAEVEVLEPASLRAEIRTELQKLLAIYDIPSASSPNQADNAEKDSK